MIQIEKSSAIFTQSRCVSIRIKDILVLPFVGGCWAAIQIYSAAWIKCLAVGLALLVQYICLR